MVAVARHFGFGKHNRRAGRDDLDTFSPVAIVVALVVVIIVAAKLLS